MCASLRSAFLLLLAYLPSILFLGTPAVSVFLLIFPVPSASIFRELLSHLWVSWGTLSSHVPVASMAGSCLILNCFSLGNIQQQRPNKLSRLLLGDVELQTQISKPVMSDSLCSYRFHTSTFPTTHSSIWPSLRTLVHLWNTLAHDG